MQASTAEPNTLSNFPSLAISYYLAIHLILGGHECGTLQDSDLINSLGAVVTQQLKINPNDFVFMYKSGEPKSFHVFHPNQMLLSIYEKIGKHEFAIHIATTLTIRYFDLKNELQEILVPAQDINSPQNSLLSILPFDNDPLFMVDICPRKASPVPSSRKLMTIFPLINHLSHPWRILPSDGILAFSAQFGSLLEIERDEFNFYLDTGRRLCAVGAFDFINRCILNAWKTIRNTFESGSPPFLFLAMPSLSGKTQMAMSLDHFAEHQLWQHEFQNDGQVFEKLYSIVLPMTVSIRSELNTQLIYRSLRWSGMIWDAANTDFLSLGGSRDAITGSVITSTSMAFQTLGLFIGLLELAKTGANFADDQRFDYTPLTLTQARIKLMDAQSIMIDGSVVVKPVVAILDEFNTSQAADQNEENVGYLLRNILRELGIVVLLSGTNANAYKPLKIVNSKSGSGKAPAPYPSLYLVRDLPSAYKSVMKQTFGDFSEFQIPNMESLMNWIYKNDQDRITVTTKPGFLIFFLRSLQETLTAGNRPTELISLINDCFQKSLRSLTIRKSLDGTDTEALYGQLAILLPRHLTSYQKVNGRPASFMHKHFANLKLDSFDYEPYLPLYRWGDEEDVSYEPQSLAPAKMYSKFPPFEADELSYMMLTSVGVSRPFPGSTADLVHKLWNSDFRNSFKSRDLLKNIAYLTTILATHYSLAGASLDSFLKALVVELLPSDSFRLYREQYKELGLHSLELVLPNTLVKLLTAIRVPYLPCAGGTASKELREIPGVCTGTLTVLENDDEIDAIATPDVVLENGSLAGLLIECTMPEASVNGSQLKHIILKMYMAAAKQIPITCNCWVGLIFVPSFSDISESIKEDIGQLFPKTAVYKLQQVDASCGHPAVAFNLETVINAPAMIADLEVRIYRLADRTASRLPVKRAPGVSNVHPESSMDEIPSESENLQETDRSCPTWKYEISENNKEKKVCDEIPLIVIIVEVSRINPSSLNFT